ncbi:MAG: ligand-binding sensor domain-containing protein [Bacteroidia bacterium]
MNRILLLLAIVFLGFGSSRAQEQVFKNITVKDGLPSATVYCMLQDKKGFIWFGTENGASRFDGVNFVNYTSKDGLTDNSILYINEDQEGRIWLHGFKGLPCFYLNDTIYNATNNNFLASLPKWGFVLSALQVKDGALYFSTDIGIIKITKNKYEKIIPDLDNKKKNKVKIDSNIWVTIPNKQNYNRIFYNENEPFIYWSQEGFVDTHNSYPNLVKIRINEKFHEPIFQKKIGKDFWICSYIDGVLKIEDITAKQPKIEEFLKGIHISMVLKDNEGNLWFSTLEKGVMLMVVDQQNMKYFPNSQYLYNENILKLCKQKNGIWVGLSKNKLAYISDSNYQQLELPLHNDTKKSSVYDIVIDKQENVIVCTSFEIFQLSKKSGKKIKWKFTPIDNKRKSIATNNKAMCIDKKNRLIVCQALVYSIFNFNKHQNKYHFDTSIKITNNRFYSCMASSSGEVYISSRNGLIKLNNYSLEACKMQDVLGDEPIIKIAELPNKNLVLVTRNKGIFVYDRQQIIQVIGEAEGLSSNICNNVWVQNNLIYVASSKGINVLKLIQNKLIVLEQYTNNDGLLSDETNDVSTLNNTIFAATASGLNCFQRKDIRKTISPPIYFMGIKNNSKEIYRIPNPVLAQDQSSLEISFRAITFQLPQNTEYAYRIVGLNPDWKMSFNNRIEYPNLPVGKFTFEVKAKKIYSHWSEPLKFKFEVTAPFYKKNTFILFGYSIVLALIFWGIYSYYKHKKKELRKKHLIQSRLETLEFQALNALMNPHFIFNALNSIQQFLNDNNALEANKFLSKFASLIRMNMESVMKRNIFVEDELERLELYLGFEKLRLSDKLSFTIEVSNEVEIDSLLIPPMILQPLVENAIWHGLAPNKTIHVFLKISPIDSNFFMIEISDNGIGYENSKLTNLKKEGVGHKSRGLDFINQRLSLWTKLNKTHFNLTIAQLNLSNETLQPGSRVSLKLPMIFEESEEI